MSDNETKLREALKELLRKIGIGPVYADDSVAGWAREVLKATEPKHAAEIEWDKWTVKHFHQVNTVGEHEIAMHFYKAGMLEAANEVANDNSFMDRGIAARVIREAASKVPTS